MCRVRAVRISGPPKKRVKRIAVCSGSGGGLLAQIQGRAEALLTGEITHHHAVEAHARGLSVIELGHYETEVLVAAPLAKRLADQERLAAAGVAVFPARRDLQPFQYL